MNKKEDQDDATIQEFNKRIKSYDALSFLQDENLANILSCLNKKPTEQEVIAELTGVQLRSLPLQR